MTLEDSSRPYGVDIDAALRIVADGAHEVRSQLAVLLLELGKLNDTNARRIEADVQRASETVNRVAVLFKLATAETLSHGNVEPNNIIRGLVARAERIRPDRSQRIEVMPSVTLAAIRGHAAFVTEALRGLLENAVCHTPANSRVIVGIAVDGTVTIDDDGPGLPPEVQRRFGEPFAHGRTPASGAGLGIAIAHQVARLHGGRCYLGPSELGGTCVCLALTATPARAHRHD
jgi:signal transduction histidine kinase